MYSGLALLLDVHHPPKSNGLGIIFITGSGFSAPLGTGAYSIKDFSSVAGAVKPLVNAGYTVFVINHRAAPQFRYPAAPGKTPSGRCATCVITPRSMAFAPTASGPPGVPPAGAWP